MINETAQAAIPQPDVMGRFESSADGAKFMAAQGIPQIPLKKKTKVAILEDWPQQASTDPAQIDEWSVTHRDCNFASVGVAQPDGFCALETDASSVSEKYKSEVGGAFERTLTIGSYKGYHYWYAHTADTIALGNIGQNGKEFSFRADGQYCVSPGSVHPVSGERYYVAAVEKPVQMPAKQVAWLRQQKKSQPKLSVQDEGQPILKGSRNVALASIAGKWRNDGLDPETIEIGLLKKNAAECVPPLPESEVRTIAWSISRYPIGRDDRVLVRGQVAGEPPVQQVADWRTLFRAVKELEDGEVKMLIRNFLVEGLVFIGGLPGEGKTLLALSMVKALTTGRNFLGRSDFTVPQQVPVLYMIPESGARAFRKRCEKFGIPSDRDKFVCRTISECATLRLDNPNLIEAVKAMKPVVFLDTVIRFSHANDENAAAQNKKLVDDIIALRQAGAVAIVGLHHATKAMRQDGINLENVLRGTGDLAAACDGVYGLMRDDLLYDHGNGPLEIDIECVKPRDFEPPLPFRVRATRKVSYDENTSTTLIGVGGRGVVSVVDESGDLQITASMSERKREADEVADRELDQLMTEKPEITLEDLAVEIDQSKATLSRTLRRLGWQKQKGQGHTWTKINDSTTR